jgi:urease accessory protein
MAALSTEYDRISQMQVAEPEPLLWSMSPLTMPSSTDDTEGSRDATGNGAIVRVMGLETEMVRNWLKQALKPLIASIGRDIFRAAFV